MSPRFLTIDPEVRRRTRKALRRGEGGGREGGGRGGRGERGEGRGEGRGRGEGERYTCNMITRFRKLKNQRIT